LLSGVGLAVRLVAAHTVGFGDSEALYASYALFPQPAYVDHPGGIGLVARMIAHAAGSAPSPEDAHLVTAIAASLAPWAVFAACRALRVRELAAALAAVTVAVVPEVAIGLFGMTPDLLLFFAWLAALGLFGRALLAAPGSVSAVSLFALAGLAVGIACASKVSGITLGLAFAVCLFSAPARAHARTPWPWLTLVLGVTILVPFVVFESRTGWPMLRHRFIDTQRDAGLSLRNAGAIVGGQALYLSPVLFVAGLVVARRLFAARGVDAVTALLASATFVPFAVLVPLCLWSRVAEPHWLAPAWLALPIYFAYAGPPAAPPDLARRGRRVRVAGLGIALAMSAAVHAWVLLPACVRLFPASAYDARLDLANELYGWPDVTADLLELTGEPAEAADVVVVGPVWMICAQLRAALPRSIPVGCVGDSTADFATWNPPRRWSETPFILFVHDNRAAADSSALFPDRASIAEKTRTILRGGRVARVFTIEVLARRATGRGEPLHPGGELAAGFGAAPQSAPTTGAIGVRPASRMRARSSDSDGFGVVSRRSP